MRYLGRLYGYYPSDPRIAYEVDSLCDGLSDQIGGIATPVFAPEDKKKEAVKNVFENILPKFIKSIEPKLNNGKKFLFGDRLTIADFWIGGIYVNWASNPNIAYGKE